MGHISMGPRLARPSGAVSASLVVLFFHTICFATTFHSLMAVAINSPAVSCDVDRSKCRVTFDLEDGSEHVAQLVRETSSLFAPDAIITSINAKGESTTLISQRRLEGGTRYHTNLGVGLWGTALISDDGAQLMEGIFSTETQGVIEFERDWQSSRPSPPTRRRALQSDIKEDLVLDPPGGKPWLRNKAMDRDGTTDSFNASRYGPGEIIPFFPNCYPQDAVMHVVKLNLVYDAGLYASLTSGMTGTDAEKQSRILAGLEAIFSPGKLIYLSQFNIRLEVQRVIFSKPTDPLPFSRGTGSNVCLGAPETMAEFMLWLSKNNALNPTGYWLLFSNCFGSINGVSYIGSLCGRASNGGVAAYAWSVIFHELGHGFGSSHSFENGVGLTGGLMDYGNTKYNGVSQFHPLKRSEICTFLSYVKNTMECPFFEPAPVGSTCGDGILSKDEECECLARGSKECGKCVECKLTDRSVECSPDTFLVRNSLSPAIVVVEPAALPSRDCCIRNKFAPPKTMCGTGLLSTCGAAGKCVATCTLHLMFNNPNCGFDESGCMLGCVWKSRCRFDMTFTGEDGSDQFISALPDGSACQLKTGGIGRCTKAHCVADPAAVPSPVTPSPTVAPSFAPTAQATAEQTSPSPSMAPVVRAATVAPTTLVHNEDPGATLNLRARCAAIKQRVKCRRAKCKWCGARRCSYDPCPKNRVRTG